MDISFVYEPSLTLNPLFITLDLIIYIYVIIVDKPILLLCIDKEETFNPGVSTVYYSSEHESITLDHNFSLRGRHVLKC